MLAWIACVLSLLLAACDSEPAPASEPAPHAEPQAEPRAPHGPTARCEGASVDPPSLGPTTAQAEQDLGAAMVAMEALAGANPGSATARVRLGELSLRTEPPRAPEAQRWFARGLSLHEEGCTLARRDHWAALEGSAIARMMQGDYAGATAFLRRSLEAWPEVRSTRYNLACALCQTGDLDGCARELTSVLDAEGAPAPSWLAEQERPAGHYARLARTDPDLQPLRDDTERFARVMSGR